MSETTTRGMKVTPSTEAMHTVSVQRCLRHLHADRQALHHAEICHSHMHTIYKHAHMHKQLHTGPPTQGGPNIDMNKNNLQTTDTPKHPHP